MTDQKPMKSQEFIDATIEDLDFENIFLKICGPDDYKKIIENCTQKGLNDLSNAVFNLKKLDTIYKILTEQTTKTLLNDFVQEGKRTVKNLIIFSEIIRSHIDEHTININGVVH